MVSKSIKHFTVQKILIPIDFSDTSYLAIEHAAFLARLLKADILLLHVMEQNWQGFSIVAPEIELELPSDFADTISKKLSTIAEDIRSEYGIACTAISSSGNICNEIVHIAKDNYVDIIVMGTHGVSGFEEFFIGSNAYKVVTRSECPVVTVQSHSKRLGFGNILLPIDDSLHSRQKVNPAVELAKRYGAKIHIAGLLDADDTDARKFEIKLDQVQTYVEKNGLAFSRKTLTGTNQAVMTLNYADKIQADLIVIMTDQDENISGRFIGPYAQQIVNHSKIPVMSIKPVLGNIEYPELSGGYHAF